MITEVFNNLIRRMAERDQHAIKEIYNEYGKLIKWIGFTVSGDFFYAEDILNEVLVKLWNEAYKLPTITSPNTWIYRFARFTAIDYYRSKIEKHKPVASLEALSGGPQYTYSDSYPDLDFLDMLQSLDEASREIIIMKLKAKMTFKEIAKTLMLPQGTVAWKYREAIKKLDEEMKLRKES